MLQQLIEQKLNKLQKTYKQTGDNYLLSQCLNPKHKDKHPSFSINTQTGNGFCFTCGYKVTKDFWVNGLIEQDVIEEQLRLQQYDELLKKYAIAEQTEGEYNVKQSVILPPKASDISFLCNSSGLYRGISLDTYNKFGVYYCNKGKFNNRIIFPLYYKDDVKAFTSRTLDKNNKTKYIHSKGFDSKSLIYPYNYLYEHSFTYVVLVEGVFDSLSCVELSIPSICNWGVALNYNKEKINELYRLGIDTIYIALDKDVAGIKAYQQFLKSNLVEYFDIKFGNELDELKDFYKSSCKDINEWLIKER